MGPSVVPGKVPLIVSVTCQRVLEVLIHFCVLAGLGPDANAEVRAPEQLVLAVEGITGSTGAVSSVARIGPRPRSARPNLPEQRCTDDLTHCISLANYIPDVCRTIEEAAGKNALDPNFFARLLWKESLFDAGAVSPAGAQGIAQFMPETARFRGLDDTFNPATALYASANYLSELSRDFGNLGLAAAAYNGGEARVERFIAKEGSVPLETRAYVQAITGHPIESWRDDPPTELDLSLEATGTFQGACIAHAANRSLREFSYSQPWGVIVASHRDRDGAGRQVARLQNRHAAILKGETVTYTHAKMPGMHRPLYNAQVGRNRRADADALCDRLRAAGGACMVLRN